MIEYPNKAYKAPASKGWRTTISLEESVDEWLNSPEIGLRFDPFRVRDAGSDSKLPLYLVDHGAFTVLWGNWPSFVFAPAGGGKTAFRVRLTHACRAGEDGRRIFPLVITALNPSISIFESLTMSAASELLLHLLYFPSHFLSQDQATLIAIRRAIEGNLAESLEHRLNQIEELIGQIQKDQVWDLLAETFGPAMCGLSVTPSVSKVQSLITMLRSLPPSPPMGYSNPQTRFEQFQTLLEALDYEAIYLLVDGVDAYLNTHSDRATAMDILQPFLERTVEWTEKGIYLKYFLPLELQEPLQEKFPLLLTNHGSFAIIEWTPGTLREVISSRLQAAAEEYRAITSLGALCTPALRGVESELLRVARPFPRDLVMLVEQIFIEHIQRVGPRGRLEPGDLDAAIKWYCRFEDTGSS